MEGAWDGGVAKSIPCMCYPVGLRSGGRIVSVFCAERGFTNASTWRLLRGEERRVAADRAWRGAGGRRTVAGIARFADGGPSWRPGGREDPAGPGSARLVPGAGVRGALGGGDSGRFLDSLRRCRASDATPWRYGPGPGGTAATRS